MAEHAMENNHLNDSASGLDGIRKLMDMILNFAPDESFASLSPCVCPLRQDEPLPSLSLETIEMLAPEWSNGCFIVPPGAEVTEDDNDHS